MLDKYESVCYELLRPEQVRDAREKCPVIYIPAGSLEWHGVQNPLGTDALKAHAICCEAALKFGGLVLPPFYQGMVGNSNWGPEGWVGYTLGLNEREMFDQAMLGICNALVFSKWRVIVGVTGHDVDPQVESMQQAIDKATDGKTSSGFALSATRADDPGAGLKCRPCRWSAIPMPVSRPCSID